MGVVRGVGTDVVDIGHFESVIARSRPGFLKRLFTENEIAYCETFKDNMASYAAIFAAKEAFLKAVRTGLAPGIRWTDVEVVHARSGAPSIVVRRRCALLLAKGQAHVSLSHSRMTAHAVVVIED
jgi:holo-[acyl-carrier protein] synthase